MGRLNKESLAIEDIARRIKASEDEAFVAVEKTVKMRQHQFIIFALATTAFQSGSSRPESSFPRGSTLEESPRERRSIPANEMVKLLDAILSSNFCDHRHPILPTNLGVLTIVHNVQSGLPTETRKCEGPKEVDATKYIKDAGLNAQMGVNSTDKEIPSPFEGFTDHHKIAEQIKAAFRSLDTEEIYDDTNECS